MNRRSKLEYKTSKAGRTWGEHRRATNMAQGLCINENKALTHGKATHGVRCYACHLTWEKTK